MLKQTKGRLFQPAMIWCQSIVVLANSDAPISLDFTVNSVTSGYNKRKFGKHLPTMPLTNLHPITVYADISCPFCFVLHERLLALEVIERIDWRTIEHAPGANSKTHDPRQITQLNTEYRLILKRASDVKVTNPGFVPNTAVVNRYLYRLASQYPQRLTEFRTLFYRALWRQGLDISDEQVLNGLLRDNGIDDLATDELIEEKLARWQRKWQFADFDLRIPVMLRDQTEVMLGLQHVKSILSFINFQKFDELEQGDLCQFISKDTVLVLCSKTLKKQLSELAHSEKTVLYFYTDEAALLSDLSRQQADLVLLDANMQGSFSLCGQVKELGADFANLPIVFFSDSEARALESRAFSTGAADFVCLKTQSDALISRLKHHIRCKHQLDILSDHAAHDGLTGLYNKREFENCLEREWRYACRHRRSIGILMLDIDHFKAFNDHYGHPAGDEALVKVASSLAECLFRGTDLAARYGGEEFVIILPNTDEESLKTIAERIREAVKDLHIQHEYSETSSQLTVSIGIALTEAHADNNYLMLIEVADQCLYQSKDDGRDQVKYSQLAAPSY